MQEEDVEAKDLPQDGPAMKESTIRDAHKARSVRGVVKRKTRCLTYPSRNIRAPRDTSCVLEGAQTMGDDIFYAAKDGDEGRVTRLLDASPSLLRSLNRNGDTTLMWATLSGKVGVVQLLIARGADIHARGRFNSTALHWVASKSPEVTRLLLSKGAQASVLDDENRTPLIEASIQGHVGVVPLLVQHMGGQGLDQPANEGRTALHWAARLGNEEMVRCLLLAGCDPTIRDKKGRTPRGEAEWRANDWREGGERSEGCAKCVTVLKWWESEPERRYLLSRATCLHMAYTTQRDKPTSQVPTYLEARVAAGHVLPCVKLMSPPSKQQQQQKKKHEAGAFGKRKAVGERGHARGAEAEGKDEAYAVLEYVTKGLNQELVTELLEGFHWGK